ncbi:DNA polymerase III subunit delta [Clostridiaceae bacterium]|nr:DNA polymerase III subunit delta [Clostridiaceae bacterium]RKI18330.1 DNA polymerase III subunit delta [bacterium 1XD21-70]
MQTLNEDIKGHSFKPVYLLFGEEAFLKNSYKNRLREAIAGEDAMNFSRFEGKGLDVDELIRMADTMPFFAEKRLILVEDSGFFKSAQEVLLKYLSVMPQTTCLLFVESEVDKRGKLYKKVKSMGYAAEMARQDSAHLARWAGAILAREGKKITNTTMDLFLNMAGDDMEHIQRELEKLICYTMGRDVVTNEDVELICTVRVSNRIFEMVAAIVNRQAKKALDLYEDLLALKEPPMRILFLIARQFNQLLQVKELMEKGMARGEIASKLKMQPFVVGKAMPQARQFSREEILSYVSLCVEMEEAVKTGRLSDRLAVELLLTKEY